MFHNPFPSSYIVGPRKEDVIRGRRKLFTKELHNLHSLAALIAPKGEERTLDWKIFLFVKFNFISTCVHHYDSYERVMMFVVCFFGVTTLWLYSHSPVAGFSLLVFEVS